MKNFIILFVLLSSTCIGQEVTTAPVSTSKPVGFQLIVDQDAFVKEFNKDRDYTMGLQLTWTGQKQKHNFVSKLFGLKKTDYYSKNWAASFAFSGFTPYALENDLVDKSDRPYAALTYLSKAGLYNFKRKTIFKNLLGTSKFKGSQFFKSATQVGFMGKGTSRAAKFIQTAVHSGQRSVAENPNDARPDPLGWEYAIASKNDIALVVNYGAEYGYGIEYRIGTNGKFLAPLQAMIKPLAGFAAGNLYNYGSGGVQFQFGFFSTSIFNGTDFSAIFDAHETKGLFEVSLTGEYNTQFWLHNATLNGILLNNKNDVYHLTYNQIEPITSYYSYGLELSYKRKFSLGYSKVIRSNVMKDVLREQVFGRLSIRIGI